MRRWNKSKHKAPKARAKVSQLNALEIEEAMLIAERNGQKKGNSKYWQELVAQYSKITTD